MEHDNEIMGRPPQRVARVAECEGGYHVTLTRLGYPGVEYVCSEWGQVPALLVDWATGNDAPEMPPLMPKSGGR